MSNKKRIKDLERRVAELETRLMAVEARPIITQWQPLPSPGPYYTGDPLPTPPYQITC